MAPFEQWLEIYKHSRTKVITQTKKTGVQGTKQTFPWLWIPGMAPMVDGILTTRNEYLQYPNVNGQFICVDMISSVRIDYFEVYFSAGESIFFQEPRKL